MKPDSQSKCCIDEFVGFWASCGVAVIFDLLILLLLPAAALKAEVMLAALAWAGVMARRVGGRN